MFLSSTLKSKAMKDTAPGPDGIPYSVYNKLWDQAGPLSQLDSEGEDAAPSSRQLNATIFYANQRSVIHFVLYNPFYLVL